MSTFSCCLPSNQCYLQLKWLCQTFGGSGFAATARGPNTHPPRNRPALDASVTSWRRRTDRDFPAEGRFRSQPLSQPCLSSSLQVQKVIINTSKFSRKQDSCDNEPLVLSAACSDSTFTATICDFKWHQKVRSRTW